MIPDESGLEESESESVTHDTEMEAHVTRSLPGRLACQTEKNGYTVTTRVTKDNRQYLRDPKGTAVVQRRYRDLPEDPREKNTKCAACGRIVHWRRDAIRKSHVGHAGEDHVH